MTSPQLTAEERRRLDQLAQEVLSYYAFDRPPVAIERILQEPPSNLIEAVDVSDLSIVFGIGEHRYEYRLAMARLLYREICRSNDKMAQGLPTSNEASRYFASTLLMPRDWVLKASRRPFVTLDRLSADFQVPPYVMATRLAQLGRRVRGME